MTGGMAFVYDSYNKFENYVNSTSVMWQIPETKHWMNYLKKLLQEYNSETNSIVSKKILNDFSNEIKNFKQICPIEMLDKLENPISLKKYF
jgi:glutamate synthase (NADPH/NADH) large chain